MFSLSKIEFEGFRSFKDKAVIEFPDTGAVLISGKYKNEEISSGSGKSSILMAVAYALGFCDLPATELKNWNSKSFYVKLLLKNNNDIIEITRNPKLELVISGETFNGIAAQEKLDKILGVNSDFLKILTYRPQRQPGSFLRAPDSEKKNLLREMLQLSDIDTTYSNIKSYHDSKSINFETQEREINFLKMNLDSWKVNEQEYENAEKAYTKYKQEIDAIKSNKELIENTNKLNYIKSEISRIGSIINQAYTKKQQNVDFKSKIKIIESELEHMLDEKCPTCFQFWKKNDDVINRKKVFISTLKNQIEDNERSISESDKLSINLSELQSEYDSIVQKTGSESAKAKEIIEKLNMAKNVLSVLSDKKSKYLSVVKDIELKENNQKNIRLQLDRYSHCLKILSNQGFLGFIFDELLQELESRVNSLISEIPNLSTFSVSIDSSQVNKNGNIKNNISIKLQKLGREVQIKALSGGQTCALELCFDLAISEIIRNRSGIKFNWVALDEAMDGLDIETKRCAMETIKKNINGLILIVDHSTEIKESFEKLINVEFDGKNSYII